MRTQHTLYTQIKQYLAFFVVTFCFVPFAFSADSCNQGQYLEDGKCNKCYTTEFFKRFHGYVCPGSWGPDAGVSGLAPCGDDTVPDEEQHMCSKTRGKEVFLKPGQYFDGYDIVNCNKENMEKLLNLYGPDGPARHSIGGGGYFSHEVGNTDSYSFYCPGGTFWVDDVRHHPKGFKACPNSGYAYDKDFKYSFCDDPVLPGTFQLTCKAGEFIPKKSTQCQSCKIVHYENWDRTSADTGLDKNQSCMKGFTATVPFGASQFADKKLLHQVCPEGAHFNETNSVCFDANGHVVEPKSTTSSNTSTNNQVDVQVYPGLGNISGPEINYRAPDTSNIKILQSVKCNKGEVWFNQQCTPCASKVIWKTYAQEYRIYCPGGEWAVGTPLLQQFKKCPRASWPNDSLTGCDCKWGEKNIKECILKKKTADVCECTNITLTSDDLYYGPKGKDAPQIKQCWTKSTDAAYKACMGFDN